MKQKNRGAWYFLAGVIVLYFIAFFVDFAKGLKVWSFFLGLLVKIVPIFVLVFVLMALTNYFVKPKKIMKFMGSGSGLKGWLLTITLGIVSSGPIYMWYPWLNDLKKQGMKSSLVAGFLYARAIKIPLLPLLIAYFGTFYAITLTVAIGIFAVIQGLVVEMLVRVKN